VSRIQLSVVERVGISSLFYMSVRPGHSMTIGCGLAVSSPQILSAPLLAFLKKGEIVKAVSPWYCVAWNTLFSDRSHFQEKVLCCLSLSSLSCRVSSFYRLDPRGLGPSFVRVCFKRCRCAPSILKGPDGRLSRADLLGGHGISLV